MIKVDYIRELIEAQIEDTQLFIVKLEVSPKNQISVQMDGDNGITIKECVGISRAIESNLDREVEDFELEVSSYGISNPLILFRQFENNIGRELEIKTKDGNVYEGELTKAEDNVVVLEYIKYNQNKTKVIEEKIYEINFEDIKEAFVQVKFK